MTKMSSSAPGYWKEYHKRFEKLGKYMMWESYNIKKQSVWLCLHWFKLCWKFCISSRKVVAAVSPFVKRVIIILPTILGVQGVFFGLLPPKLHQCIATPLSLPSLCTLLPDNQISKFVRVVCTVHCAHALYYVLCTQGVPEKGAFHELSNNHTFNHSHVYNFTLSNIHIKLSYTSQVLQHYVTVLIERAKSWRWIHIDLNLCLISTLSSDTLYRKNVQY